MCQFFLFPLPRLNINSKVVQVAEIFVSVIRLTYFTCMKILSPCSYVYLLHASTCRGQKKAPDFPVLELQMGVSHYVGTRNWTHILYKRNKCFWLLSNLSSTLFYQFGTEDWTWGLPHSRQALYHWATSSAVILLTFYFETQAHWITRVTLSLLCSLSRHWTLHPLASVVQETFYFIKGQNFL